jgi:uncharacterized membrane protein (UPF0127 family)
MGKYLQLGLFTSLLGLSVQLLADAAVEYLLFDIQDQQLVVEVALSPEQRSRGLMNRLEMPANAGMLFILDPQPRQCFWMRNTYIPLTLAFLDEHFTLLQLSDMQPLSEELHCADQPSRFALEVHQGWFEQHDINVGQQLQPRLP